MKIYCDGSCYHTSKDDNFMGVGVYAISDNAEINFHACAGRGTHNIAEYMAIISALLLVKETINAPVTIHSDSQLVIYQIIGTYQCRDEKLMELLDTVREILDSILTPVSFKWVRRTDEFQQKADKLSNRGNPHYNKDLVYKDLYEIFKNFSTHEKFNLQHYADKYQVTT
jgi:ribonuclease HI